MSERVWVRHGEDVDDYSMCVCGLPMGYCSADECERCEGTGDLYGRSVGPIAICPDCNGAGYVTQPESTTP